MFFCFGNRQHDFVVGGFTAYFRGNFRSHHNRFSNHHYLRHSSNRRFCDWLNRCNSNRLRLLVPFTNAELGKNGSDRRQRLARLCGHRRNEGLRGRQCCIDAAAFPESEVGKIGESGWLSGMCSFSLNGRHFQDRFRRRDDSGNGSCRHYRRHRCYRRTNHAVRYGLLEFSYSHGLSFRNLLNTDCRRSSGCSRLQTLIDARQFLAATTQKLDFRRTGKANIRPE